MCVCFLNIKRIRVFLVEPLFFPPCRGAGRAEIREGKGPQPLNPVARRPVTRKLHEAELELLELGALSRDPRGFWGAAHEEKLGVVVVGKRFLPIFGWWFSGWNLKSPLNC